MLSIELLRTLVILLLAVPAVAAVVVAWMGPQRRDEIRQFSLIAVALELVLAIVLVIGFVSVRAELSSAQNDVPMTQIKTFQPEIVPGASPDNPHRTTWRIIDFGRSADGQDLGGIDFFVGIDGMNLWLIVLTALLMLSAVLISWSAIAERANEYYAWLLLLGTAMTGVFLSFDLILFYIFFELTLVPLFFLIGIWGGPERRHAARKFFIYTLAGSVITLLGLLAVVLVCHDRHPGPTRPLTFSIPELVLQVNTFLATANSQEAAFWSSFQFWVFLALVAGFAIKVPLVPLHTWLPLAHVEAPTAGSVLLAGVLLKVGTYGFLRLCLPLTPEACWTVGLPLIGTLAVVGIIYGAFCALSQEDIKKLVAYSSVSHMGFCMLGMFALNLTGLTGSLLAMLNHGLATGALFLLVGMLYERYHTRKMSEYGGMGARLKLLTVCMVFICLSSAGLPGLNGFVGEALVFFGMFPVDRTLAVIGTAGIVLGAWYLFTMLRRVFFGELKEPAHAGHRIGDMNLREWVAVGPIMILCLVIGVYPQPLIDVAEPDLRVVGDIVARQSSSQVAKAMESGRETAQVDRSNHGE